MRFVVLFLLIIFLLTGCSKKESSQTSTQSAQKETSRTLAQKQSKSSQNEILVQTTLPTSLPENQYITTSSGLKYADIKVGTGEKPKPGDLVVVHYTGWLTNGKRFDSSVLKNKPFKFLLGYSSKFGLR